LKTSITLVCARVIDYRAADRARDVDRPFQPGKTLVHAAPRQRRQPRATLRDDLPGVLDAHAFAVIDDHQPAIARVRNQHIRPAAQHDPGHPRAARQGDRVRQVTGAVGDQQRICRTAQPRHRIARQRLIALERRAKALDQAFIGIGHGLIPP
jgi:hypothetical protein